MDKAAQQLEDMNGLKEDPDALWTPAAAARFLGVTPSSLAKWRGEGGGPDYVRVSVNRVKYQRKALVAWIEAKKAQSTSAETVAAGKAGAG